METLEEILYFMLYALAGCISIFGGLSAIFLAMRFGQWLFTGN